MITRHTDRQMDGWEDRVIPIYPPPKKTLRQALEYYTASTPIQTGQCPVETGQAVYLIYH